MPSELPYLPSYKNVAKLFDKIRAAKIPEAFTTRYLANTLGLKNTNDRALITLLKTLGFLDNSGQPTERYAALKNDKIAKKVIAEGIKEAYASLFSANESANELSRDDLKGLVAQVAGTDAGTTTKIVGTFAALSDLADYSPEAQGPQVPTKPAEEVTTSEKEGGMEKARGSLRPDFHYNIQIHLPSNGTEETYINIFNAVRRVFK